MVWKYLDSLPDEAVSDVSMLVLIAPSEAGTSGANIEFEGYRGLLQTLD